MGYTNVKEYVGMILKVKRERKSIILQKEICLFNYGQVTGKSLE